MVQLANSIGAVTKNYRYDAFGVVQSPVAADANPFRYCGEQYDNETGNLYLRARYYDSKNGRFLSEDSHWNPGNMLYGDNPTALNERTDDPLGLNAYTYTPDMAAIRQSGNLYTYCMNSPIMYVDEDGEFGILATIAIGAGVGALVSGGFQIFRNIKNGQAWTNGLGKALLSGAVSGAISVIPIPGMNAWAAVAITGAAGNLAGQLIAGEVKSSKDVVSALSAGAVAGIIGKGAADMLSKGFQSYFQTLTKAQQKSMLNSIGNISNRTLTAIRQEVGKGLTNATLNELVKKYGYDVIVSAFVSSTTATAIQ